MRKFRKSLIIISSIALLSGVGASVLTSCGEQGEINKNPSIEILNGDVIEVKVDEYVELNIKKTDINGEIYYSSTNEDIAIVSSNGRIYGLKEGETIIKAYSGEIFDTVKVIVRNEVPSIEPSIKIENEGSFELGLSRTESLGFITTNFEGQVNTSLSVSGIIEIVEVKKETVLIKGLKEGKTILTLSINDKIKDSIEIIVKDTPISSFNISLSHKEIKRGQDVQIKINIAPEYYKEEVKFYVFNGSNCVEIENTTIHTLKSGYVKLEAECRGVKSNKVDLTIYDFNIKMDSQTVEVGKNKRIQVYNYEGNKNNLQAYLSNSNVGYVNIGGVGDLFFNATNAGTTQLYLYDKQGMRSNQIQIDIVGGDPYGNLTKEEFYNDYKRAPNYQDAMYRSKHNFMSGDISAQDQKPTISRVQPKVGDKFVHNSNLNYTNGGKTYVVPDVYGNEAFEIYEGAAYVTLEEVAAYVYAFGDVPVNYSNSKKTKPSSSPWKEYLRVNHSPFSGSTASYPFEPVLPDISGCGGNLEYYEMDIGTTGTDCDPSFPSHIYNDGNRITRGAARIVYSRFYEDTGKPVSPEDRYVFYTYNHYNDFQEYLNYENGWGEMFGNITGGGVLSSKNPSECNPTPYVETVRQSLK